MIKKRLIFILIAGLLLLTACVRPSPEITNTPEPTLAPITAPPTSTPTRLSPLYRLTMFLGGYGWATDLDRTQFYNTRNFGEHWLTVTPADLSSQGYGWGVFTAFPSGDVGWICQTQTESTALLYSSTNGGFDWQTQELDFPCGQMSFMNDKEGYILADLGAAAGSHFISIYYTSDGGQNWERRFEHEPASADDHGLPTGGSKSYFGFLSSNIGLVSGSVPIPGAVYLYRTVDGGTSWLPSECQGLLLDEDQQTSVDNIIRIDAATAILPIRSYLANGNSVTYFCGTTDAAENWSYVGMLENIEFFDFGTLLTGVAYGQGKMYQTSDGGASWIETTAGLPLAVTPVALDMINDLVGFLTATITPDTLTDNRIYMTVNNGKDWQSLPANIIESSNIGAVP